METLQPLNDESHRVREQAGVLGQLFDLVEDSYLFVKDREHRFVRCNRAMWMKYGLSCEADVLGKRDSDFFPPALAKAYVAEDRKVMETRIAVLDAVWLVPSRGALRWYRCSKLPVLDDDEVIGVAGILRPYDGEGEVPQEYERIKPALVLANRSYSEQIRVSDLASKAGYSVNQFGRIFQHLFRMKPVDYLKRLRLEEAARLLRTTRLSMCDIALRCGFYDQSAFSKSFRQRNGVTPRKYRERFGR
jgi:AraC-like DNA-binding protein